MQAWGEVEVETVRGCHRDYYLAWAEETEQHLMGADQKDWFVSLEADNDNLRIALKWCQDKTADKEAGLRLAGALGRFWEVRGYWSEGYDWLNRMLAKVPDRTIKRAKALYRAGRLAWRQKQHQKARSLYEEGLSIYLKLQDDEGIGSSYISLGHISCQQREYEAAQSQYEKGLKIFQDIKNQRGIAWSYNGLGVLAEVQRQYDQASQLLEKALGIYREIDDKGGMASSLNHLAAVAFSQGKYDLAYERFRESLNLYWLIQHKVGITECFEGLGMVWAVKKDPLRAARLWGTAEAQREYLKAFDQAPAQAGYSQLAASVRDVLGVTKFTAEKTEGQNMTLEQAIACALEGSE